MQCMNQKLNDRVRFDDHDVGWVSLDITDEYTTPTGDSFQ